MQRYYSLLYLIQAFKPKTIVEIGVWNGENAERMIKCALQYHDDIQYIGYDLFEGANTESDKKEFNVKPHFKYDDIKEKLSRLKADVTLVKGDTNLTLTPTVADFAFIDGGHSIETIRADYEKLKRSKVIVLDDYYTPDNLGKCPDINKMGCNKIVENIQHQVIYDRDWIMGGGQTNLAVTFG